MTGISGRERAHKQGGCHPSPVMETEGEAKRRPLQMRFFAFGDREASRSEAEGGRGSLPPDMGVRLEAEAKQMQDAGTLRPYEGGGG